MKPTLQFKLSQHLTLTPQLQQSIRLLQLSTVELNQEIERIAQENPLLELDDTPANDVSDYRNSAVHNDLEPLSADSIEIPEEGGAALAIDIDSDIKKNASDEPDWFRDDGASRSGRDDEDERDFPQQAAEPPSLREYLNLQLSLSQIPERD